jgi:hypothetical protein
MLRRFVTLLVGLLVGVLLAATTTASAATSIYDAPTVARVYVHEFGDADANPIGFNDAQEGSASPSADVPGASTPANPRSVATMSLPALRQGVTKTGYYDPVARTFVGTVDDTVTTVIRNASPNYIQNLQAAAP